MFSKKEGNDQQLRLNSVEAISPRESKLSKYFNYGKIVFLFFWWLTILLLIIIKGAEPHKPYFRSVSSTQPIDLEIEHEISKILRVHLNGPFKLYNLDAVFANQAEDEHTLDMTIERVTKDNDGQETNRVALSSVWKLEICDDEDSLDSAPLSMKSKIIELSESPDTDDQSSIVFNFKTDFPEVVSFQVTMDSNAVYSFTGFLIGMLLLLVYFILIVFDLVHRTLAAMLVSSMSVAILGVVHTRPTLFDLMSWMDMEIFMIQFGMSIIVTILLRTGIYDFLAVRAYKISRGHVWPFLNMLIVVVTVSAMILENGALVLLIGPFVLLMCQLMSINTIPVVCILCSFLIVSKIALPFSSILNIRVGHYLSAMENTISPEVYTAHTFPFCVLMIITTYIYFRLLFFSTEKIGQQPTEADILKHIIHTLDDTAHAIAGYTRGEKNIRTKIETQSDKLSERLKRLGKLPQPVENFDEKLAGFHNKLGIRNQWFLIACTIALLFILILCIVNIVDGTVLPVGWVVVLASFFLIIVLGVHDFEELLYHVDWCTLVFLSCQQIFTRAFDEMGFNESLVTFMRYGIVHSENSQLIVGLLLILALTIFSSLMLDNINLARVMIQNVALLTSERPNLPLNPLIWATNFGLHVGSQGTQIASTTCIVFSGLLARHGINFPFLKHLKICFPLMLINSIVTAIYLLTIHVGFGIL